MPTIEELEQQFKFKPNGLVGDLHWTNREMSSSNSRFRFARCLKGLREVGNWKSGRTKFVSCTCRGFGCDHVFCCGDYFWWGPHMPIGERTLCPDCYRKLISGLKSKTLSSKNNNKIFSLIQ